MVVEGCRLPVRMAGTDEWRKYTKMFCVFDLSLNSDPKVQYRTS